MGRYPVLMVGIAGIAIALGGVWSSRQNAVPTDGAAFLFQGVVGDTASPRVSPTVTPTPKVVSPTVSPKTSVSPIATQTVTPISTPLVTPVPTVTMSPTVTPEHAPSGDAVFISEIAWAGTRHSASDEWIELGNSGDSPVSLEGWRLRSDDGSPDIALSGAIAPHGTFLIERTNDETLPSAAADLATSFGRGGIKNDGERIVLIAPDGSEKDTVNCSSGWFAGDSATYASMERISSLLSGSEAASWRTYTGSGQGLDGGGNVVLGSPKTR